MPETPDLTVIDLEHAGLDRRVGAYLCGDVLIDCGPESCLPRLYAALDGAEVQPRLLLLTHIHLDHAGAAGALAARFPELQVAVHTRGARHLVDPQRLVAGATALYGDRMSELWGGVQPVPVERIIELQGGEVLDGFGVIEAPGHARHHVVFLEQRSETLFAGDVCGVRVEPSTFVLPPTPPSDIDIAAWLRSLDAVEAAAPKQLALTHFGVFTDVERHLTELRLRLGRWRELSLAGDQGTFERELAADLAEIEDRATARRVAAASPPEQMWLGVAEDAARTRAA